MVNNLTTIVCDVLPVWKGYVWGAQGGVTWDVCSLFLVTVPPAIALVFALLYLQTTLQTSNSIVDRIDDKLNNFNQRVESIILHLRSKKFQEQVHTFTDDMVSTFNKVPIPKLSFQSSEQAN